MFKDHFEQDRKDIKDLSQEYSGFATTNAVLGEILLELRTMRRIMEDEREDEKSCEPSVTVPL